MSDDFMSVKTKVSLPMEFHVVIKQMDGEPIRYNRQSITYSSLIKWITGVIGISMLANKLIGVWRLDETIEAASSIIYAQLMDARKGYSHKYLKFILSASGRSPARASRGL